MSVWRDVDNTGAVGRVSGLRPVRWDELIEQCSRLHTTRTRPVLPWEPEGKQRENSRPLDVWLPGGRRGTVVPTWTHEPGFYVRAANADRGFRARTQSGRR